MPFRRSFSRAQRGPRRQTQWLASPDNAAHTVLAGGAAQLFGTLSAAEIALQPFTIIRTVGMVSMKSDQITATEDPLLAIGMAVISIPASAIGVTAVPTPIVDEASDLWFLYETLAASFTFGDGTGFNSPSSYTKYFDSRAQRKVQEGDDVGMMAECASGVGCSFYWKMRMLVMLH